MPKRTKVPSKKCKQPTMVCASCRGTDHQCRQKEDVETRDEEGIERHIEDEEISDDESEGDATPDAASSISYPNFIELKSRRNRAYEPVVDVADADTAYVPTLI
eukprot:3826889-Ditylum_brightwellii.AAC.1